MKFSKYNAFTRALYNINMIQTLYQGNYVQQMKKRIHNEFTTLQ